LECEGKQKEQRGQKRRNFRLFALFALFAFFASTLPSTANPDFENVPTSAFSEDGVESVWVSAFH
jgi:hypothetical protein